MAILHRFYCISSDSLPADSYSSKGSNSSVIEMNLTKLTEYQPSMVLINYTKGIMSDLKVGYGSEWMEGQKDTLGDG